VLSVEVVGEPDTTPGRDDVLPPFDEAAAWVVRRCWRELETQRRFRVAADSRGNVVAKLRWSRAPSGISARLEVGPPGGLQPLGGEVQAGSIREAAEALYRTLAARVGEGQPTLPLSPEEAERAAQAHAPTPEAYLAYSRIYDGYSAREQVDAPRYLERMQELVTQFPTWGLPALVQCVSEGVNTDACRHMEATAMAAGQPQDVSDLFVAFALVRKGKTEQISLLKTFLQAPVGPVGEFRSAMSQFFYYGSNEGAAWVASQRPDLQFRAASIRDKASSGHPSEAREQLRSWLSVAPGNEQAWLLAAQFAVTAGAPASRTVEELLRLQGKNPDILLCVADLALAQFHPEAALALTNDIPSTTPFYAALKRRRAGNAYLMMGQFRRARDQLMAAREQANTRDDFNWFQTSRDLVTISGALGDREAAAQWRAALLEDSRRLVMTDIPVGIRYLDLDAKQRCPPMEGLLTNIEPAGRRNAERLLARLAFRGGCGDCEQVLARGEADVEGYIDSVTVLVSCLEGAGRTSEGLKLLEPHLLYFEVMNWSVSVAEVVRAQYWHGRLLEQSGDLVGARAAYARFVELWGNADAPIPEMPDARARLKALTVETEARDASGDASAP
jgi:tetratricopeptide (TPR) repeat protein